MTNSTFKIEGHDGQAYTVFEYSGAGAIYVYRGYVRGNVIHLYPKHSLCKGVKRGKMMLSLSELKGGMRA